MNTDTIGPTCIFCAHPMTMHTPAEKWVSECGWIDVESGAICLCDGETTEAEASATAAAAVEADPRMHSVAAFVASCERRGMPFVDIIKSLAEADDKAAAYLLKGLPVPPDLIVDRAMGVHFERRSES